MLTTLYAGKDENRKYAAKQHSTLGPVQMIFAKPTEDGISQCCVEFDVDELGPTRLFFGRPCRSIHQTKAVE